VVRVVAGIHPNSEIRRVKQGSFLNSEAEKERILRACKFVDEVLHGVPYLPMEVKEFKHVDFWMHGDDEVIVKGTGKNLYEGPKVTGRFRYIRRTEGISSLKFKT
jgi:ethanolamine-phosphate cytidylyltransferase